MRPLTASMPCDLGRPALTTALMRGSFDSDSSSPVVSPFSERSIRTWLGSTSSESMSSGEWVLMTICTSRFMATSASSEGSERTTEACRKVSGSSMRTTLVSRGSVARSKSMPSRRSVPSENCSCE